MGSVKAVGCREAACCKLPRDAAADPPPQENEEMKTRIQISAAATAFALVFAVLASTTALATTARAASAAAQDQPYGAIERGYRTGYSDGYQAGWSDQARRASADYRTKEDYRRADRAYVGTYGPVEDYRDGYQQGFEAGYGAGYNRRGFDSNLPQGGVRRRGSIPTETADGVEGSRPAPNAGDDAADDNRAQQTDPQQESASSPRGSAGGGAQTGGTQSGGGRVLTGETVMLVELQNRLSTDVSQTGDRFEATVLEPQEYAGAVVAGRLRDVQRPGKAKGRALLQLDFDQIKMAGGDWQDFSGQVTEVIPSGNADEVGEVDPEGGVRGKSTTKDDVAKVGASAGIGAIIGAIAGGGKGAAIGAVLGGGASTAGVMTQRGKDIRLERGQQLRIRATSRGR